MGHVVIVSTKISWKSLKPLTPNNNSLYKMKDRWRYVVPLSDGL